MRTDDQSQSNNASHIEDLSADGGSGRDKLETKQSGQAAPPVSPQAIRMYPGPDGIVQLPAGVEMSDVRVVGNDLLITLPNGVQWIIVDGAIYVPTLSFGAVQVPAENVAALLDIENFILVGARQSSGGNFAVEVGGIGDPFALGDLLPPTDLSFDTFVSDEIVYPFPDEDPGVIVITPDTPVGSVTATDTVNEPGLPARPDGPPGTDAPAPSETTTGTITITSGDPPFVVTINGTVITTVGQVITTPTGTLTVTGIGTNTIDYSYTLTDNTSGDTTTDILVVVVTDSDGDTATGSVTITIVDDNPIAAPDSNSVGEGGIISVNAANGVLVNDIPGADGFAAGGGVVGVRAAAGNTTNAVATGVGTVIQGQFGTLTLQANGSYVYDAAPNAVPTGGATDVFVYTIRDGDGDQATTTLTISLSDAGLAATADGDLVVDEAALPIGSNPPSNAETATGTLADGNVSGGTGPYSYAIVGSNVGSYGTLTLNADGSYSYTLTSPFDTSPDANNGTNLENNRDTYTYQVTDANGNSSTSTISIDIIDDIPTAVLNTDSVVEGATASGNVVANDIFGADGPAAGGGVVGVRAAGGDSTSAVTTGVGTVIQGQFGTLTLQADGSYVYNSTPNAAPAGGGSDIFVYTIRDGDGDQSTTTLTIDLSGSGLRATADDSVVVDEAALPIGSDPGSTAETATGTLADGNVSGGTGPYSYALVGSGAGTYGTLTLNADGSYSYTLATPYDTSPDANNGTNLEDNRDTFTYQVTDLNGNTTTSTISIDIIDDIPTASPNSNGVTEGAILNVDPANGVLPNDVFGADGPAAGGGVIGVRAAGGDTTNAVTTGTGTVIQGVYGTLTLQADGSYVYQADPNVAVPGGVEDVFVYTIQDGDGDQSTTTLTINVNDGNLSATADDAVVVNEAALAIGSNPPSNAETATGTLADGNVSGGTGPYSYAIVGSNVGAYGTLTLNPDGSYSYTLTSPFDTSPDADNGTNLEDNRDTFTYEVTDANGNTTTSTISIDIIDDVPTAAANSNSAAEGAVIGGNVLGNDIFGADGPAAGGGVIGVRAAGGDTTSAVTTGTAAVIQGLYGKLTLQADGSYVYDGDPNVVPPQGATDVFVYTIQDGDGDRSTTTLTIDLTDSAVRAPTDTDVLVNENALDLAQTGQDLAPGTVVGSLPGSTAETDASNQLNADGGTGPYTYALQTGGNAATAGTYGTIQVNANGSYTYTLTDNFLNADADDGPLTINGVESFTYVVTDANGNSSTGTISINVVDDVPTANADFNSVAQGALLSVNAANGILSNDALSADGTEIAGVRAAGGNTTTDVTNGNLVVVTALGTLTVAANGSYTYQANPNVGPATDVFVYTIVDGDGDLSTTTLEIDIAGPDLTAPDDFDVTVNEAGLDTSIEGSDLAFGTVTGSLGTASGSETDSTNQLNASGGTGPYVYALQTGGNAATAGTYGTIQVNADGSYTYTLTSNFDNATANDGVQTINGVETFTYTVTDANLNTTTGTISINVIDDVPTATLDTGSVGEGATLTVLAGAGILANDTPGADGASIAGVRAAGGDTTTAVTNGTLVVATALGTLTVAADGSYTYVANANSGPATDTFVYTIVDGDGDLSTTTLAISITDSGLVAPLDTDVTVNEAGLDTSIEGSDLAFGTVTGSLGTASGSETDSTNQLNASGGTGPYVYALQTGGNAATAGTYGTIQVNADGSYTYTLTSNFDNATANDGVQTINGVETFTYTVTDANLNTTTGTISINVIDDVPTATLDTGSVGEGATLTVLAGAGILANDTPGADGASIAGVRAAGGDTTTAVTNGTLVVATALGTLTVAADGSYTYVANANSGPATDTFVYTIVDGDGDLSTTTLAISITDSGLVAPLDTDVTVNEAGLDTSIEGSDLAFGTVTGSLGTASGSETDSTNQLNASGGTGPYVYALQTGGNAATAGTYGTIQVNADGSYTYTLTSNFDNATANDGVQTINGVETFTYTVTDANLNTTTGTISINVIDDVPTATLDTGSVGEGATLTVLAGAGILANDTPGADGASIAGVRAAGGDTTTAVTNGTLVVATALGTLTVAADGSYTYVANANSGPATDTFVYTIVDGDGDLSTTTLAISITDSGLVAPLDTDVTVNEAGLDTSIEGSDLAFGTVTGSLGTASGSETDSTNQLNASGGTGPYVYALQTGGNAATAGTYGTIQVNADGSYTYTLTSNFDNATANDGVQTINGVETFTYTVTDANLNTTTGTISINVIDDVPTATLDTGSVGEGATLTVLAGAGILANDTPGADGASIAGVRAAGGDTTTAVTNGTLVVATALGTLTVAADGSYTYVANANSGPATDTFVYTIVDGDGDLSTTTLAISITDSGLVAPLDTDVTVNEAGLDTSIEGSDLAFGTVTGSLGTASGSETDSTNQLNASGGTGPYVYALQTGGNAATAGTYGTIQVNADGSYTYTLTSNFDNATANDGVQTINGVETFTYTVTDANLNTTTGTISINVIDDVPTALAPKAVTVTNVSTQTGTNFLDADNDVDNNYGADGPGKVFFQQSLETVATGLTSGNQTVVYDVSADGLILTGYVNVGAAGYVDGIDTKVFTVELQPVGSPDQYKVTIFQPLDAITTIDFDGAGYDFVGGNPAWNAFRNAAVNPSQDILLTPIGSQGQTVNTTANAGGVGGGGGGNNVGSNEGIRVDFVVDVLGNPSSGGSGYQNSANRNHTFSDHYTVNGASAVFASTAGSTVRIRAFTDPDGVVGNDLVGDGVEKDITSIAIKFGVETKIITTNGPHTVGGQVFTVTFGALDVLVAGVVTGAQIASFTASPGYNSIEFTYVAGDAFQLGDFGASVNSTTTPVTWTVPISIEDGDGDVTSAGNLSITANPPPPVVLDLDGDGVEFIAHSAGVAFDYGGDGSAENTGWVGPDDALLVHDANSDRVVNDGSEIVFSVNGSTDLEGVRLSYDSDGDGKLTAADAAFSQFGVWQDANSNGRTDAGEYRTLTEAGIVSIDLMSDGVGYSPNADVRVSGSSTYTRADGSVGLVADASFGVSAVQAQRASGQMLTQSIVAAGLVATVGVAVSPVPAAAAPVKDVFLVSQGRLILDDSELPVAVRDPAELLSSFTRAGESIEQVNAPSRFMSHEEPHSGQFDAVESISSVRSPSLSTQDHISPVIVDHSSIPVAPMVDMSSAALLAAPAAQLSAVLADALPHSAGGPEIDSLLSHLPSGGGAAAASSGGGGMDIAGSHMAPAMGFDAGGFDLSAFVNANMIMQDAVTATSHA